MKGIDVNLPEERGWHCDYGWDVNLMEVSGLTDVARICKPFDVHTHVRPPETFYEMNVGGKHTVVAYLVMGLSE